MPDVTPVLRPFAQLRRFTLAVLAAAETAADFAGILYTGPGQRRVGRRRSSSSPAPW